MPPPMTTTSVETGIFSSLWMRLVDGDTVGARSDFATNESSVEAEDGLRLQVFFQALDAKFPAIA